MAVGYSVYDDFNWFSRGMAVRYRADGSPDPTFDGDGRVVTTAGADLNYWDVAAAADGSLFAAGFIDQDGTARDVAVVKYGIATANDYTAGVNDWSSGSNLFGACLRALSGTGVGGAWTVNATCPATDGTYWNAIPVTSGSAGSKIAASTTSATNNATAALKFGFRAASNQPPGTYTAPIVFEVAAPNV